MIAYGVPADAMDDYVRMSESTALQCLKKIVVAVVEVFGPKYLKLANKQGTIKLLATCCFMYAWFHRLRTLGLKKLSYCLA
jgi:hypothetical protein